MTNRELDAKVAEMMNVKVLRPSGLGGSWLWTPHGYGTDLPHFTTDAGADYLVLEHVRKDWDNELFTAFIGAFERRVSDHAAAPRECNHWSMYNPGDYSRAALDVIEGKETACHS